MMMIRRLTILATLTCGITVTGCGGGSSVSPQTSQAFLQGGHLDSLAVQAANAGFFDRYRLLAYPTAALMQNLSPSTVTLSVDGSFAVVSEASSWSWWARRLAAIPPPPTRSTPSRCGRTATPMRLCFTQIAQPDTALEDAPRISAARSPTRATPRRCSRSPSPARRTSATSSRHRRPMPLRDRASPPAPHARRAQPRPRLQPFSRRPPPTTHAVFLALASQFHQRCAHRPARQHRRHGTPSGSLLARPRHMASFLRTD